MSNWTLKEHSIGDLEVTIEGETWLKAVGKAFSKLAKDVEVKGFRKGQAPKALVEKKISAAERFMQAIDDNANEWMRDALAEKGLTPISQPQLDVKSVDDGSAVLVYTFAVMPEVKLGDYKSLSYEAEDASVSDEDVDKEIESMRQRYAEMEVKEGAAEEGDTVNINYEGFKDGVAFDGGKAENYDLVLGSNSFIPGFEEQLIGVSAGDEKELNLKFPEEYHAAELAGADVVFKVKVNEVKRKVLPELNDEFAEDLNMPNISNVEELKANVRTRLEERKKNEVETAADNKMMDQLVDLVEADIPDALVEEEVQNQIQQLASQIQQYGMSLTQYLQMTGMNAESLKESYKENAIKTVKMRLGLEEVAKQENLEPTDEDVEAELQNIASMYSMEIERVKELLDAELVKRDIRNQKAFDLLKAAAKKVLSAE